ncbi:Crp/Fnr family transcriptional regulator [Pedobacter duraquae]|uniref:CRP-like cAMP-binding protein n=1 Tax=Pedobacter duraquae TaxID=425511 RepID=A0A4R6IRP9_9SPHI|nr:Crp/Fnr family transcriptional regulator [Pedobacter duraquae]TDO24937.1 CRP-like cAMP-binding protein [Pedobacter duraquae]
MEIKKIERLENVIREISGMSLKDFELSKSFWYEKDYKKGEFYNEYKNVCKYLGFVISGVFRIYKYDEQTNSERNILFFSNDQFMSSYKSFLSQTSCAYYTESMTNSEILYIHYDDLQYLYKTSPAWEHFGRIFAETVLHAVMHNTELLLFKTAEERYVDMLQQHPDILQSVQLYHIASYLGIEGPSLSRIRKRMGRR